jgi:glucosamine-6-phosphate deaminase
MSEKLLKHIDIAPENTNIPDGTIEKKDIESFCNNYEEKILENGGIDL